jgi:hypothetical protein
MTSRRRRRRFVGEERVLGLDQGSGVLDVFGHGIGTPTCGAHCINVGVARILTRSLSGWQAGPTKWRRRFIRSRRALGQHSRRRRISTPGRSKSAWHPPVAAPSSRFAVFGPLQLCGLWFCLHLLATSPTRPLPAAPVARPPPLFPPGACNPPPSRHRSRRNRAVHTRGGGARRSKQAGRSRASCQVIFSPYINHLEITCSLATLFFKLSTAAGTLI